MTTYCGILSITVSSFFLEWKYLFEANKRGSNMSELMKFNDYIVIEAKYKDPQPHRHLAAHIILSLGGKLEWEIDGKGNDKVSKQQC